MEAHEGLPGGAAARGPVSRRGLIGVLKDAARGEHVLTIFGEPPEVIRY
ncbi:MAG: hypothetical protein HY712_00065 [candidate division NC10 bacterium]|nr:hypothetical protein [candidate division NC10 bacterium]